MLSSFPLKNLTINF